MDLFNLAVAEALAGGGGGGSITVEPLSVTENNTYTAPSGKAYSPVTVNVSGGGSSDFSTATVTVEYTKNNENITPSFDGSEYLYIDGAFEPGETPPTLVSFIYGDNGLPLSELGTPNEMSVPIYKDYASDITSFSFKNGADLLSIDIYNSQVVSGDASIDGGYFLITGDCSLKIALIVYD